MWHRKYLQASAILALIAMLGVALPGCSSSSLHGATDATALCAKWESLDLSANPGPRWLASAAYDPMQRGVVLLGGHITPDARQNAHDMWLLTEQRWEAIQTDGLPNVGIGSAIAFDDSTNSLLALGGDISTEPGVSSLGSIWMWNGFHWQASTSDNTPAAIGATASYDPQVKSVIEFGGLRGSFSSPSSDTWVFDGVSWSRAVSADIPPPRVGAYMTYDPKNRKVLMYGGTGSGSQMLRDLWSWTPAGWRQELAPNSSGRPAGLVYDSQLGEVLAFLASPSPSPLGAIEVQRRDALGWTSVSSPEMHVVPPAEYSPIIAYDPQASGTILFGGLQIPIPTSGAAIPPPSVSSRTWVLRFVCAS